MHEARAEFNGRVLYEPSWGPFDVAMGAHVVSVFGGAADREKYGDSEDFIVARVQTPNWSEADLRQHAIYQKVRNLREKTLDSKDLVENLKQIFQQQQSDFPDEWLLALELLEIVVAKNLDLGLKKSLEMFLQKLKLKFPDKADIIQDGMNLADHD